MKFDFKSTQFFKSTTSCHALLVVFSALLLTSCATYRPQYGKIGYKVNSDTLAKSPLLHTFYLVGDAGNARDAGPQEHLVFFRKRLAKASSKSTLLFLGDNIYPSGMPPKGDKGRRFAEENLESQIALTEGFKGKSIFIPGNHDWYSNGVEGVRRQQDYITEKLGKKSFLPKNGCPIDDVGINDRVALITVDSQWYMENWDDDPEINDDCDIKTREDFFTELEDKLNENQTKLTVLAIHHPVMSDGTHGGELSWRKQLYPLKYNIPLPVIGSLMNLVRKTSGGSPQDLQHKIYKDYIQRIRALVQGHENVVIVSGHDHNLQYVEKDGVRQIISGSGSKVEAARAVNGQDFTYGGNGYALLQVYEQGESVVTYYGNDGKEEKLLFRHQITPAREKAPAKAYGNTFPKYTTATVYDKEMTEKSAFHNFLWGKHYRSYYGRDIQARNVTLDTLYGGLKPVESGGGHQSRSLRLEDKSGKQYTMRAIKKSAVKFLQSTAFKKQYVEQEFKETYAESFLMDFYTSSHPFTSFAVDNLAGAAGIPHTNPRLYYVPKQSALGDFNLEYGDELYLIEERPDDGFEKLASFGKPDAFESTLTVLENLRKDEKYQIDEKAYIRARLFDMLIGDWDRHYDQWRWGEYESKDGKIVYKPIPRDRDQAFPKYGGALLPIILNMPALRHMKTYKKDIASVKWLNAEAYALDLALITRATRADWEAEARYLREHLTDAEIEKAFSGLPKEVQDKALEGIKANLRSRRNKVERYANEYYDVLQRIAVVVGTEKKDRFVVTRLGNGDTEVSVIRLKKEGEEVRYTRTYRKKETREIWIYGLGDEDIFEVPEGGKAAITVRLLGGGEKDAYNVKNGKRVTLYDFRSRENDIEADGKATQLLSNNYDLNRYDYRKPKYDALAGLPNIGFNPDDGIKIGLMPTFTVNGFKRNPYSQKHALKANYYFATKGYELIYKGIFPNILRNWRFELDARYTGPVFTFNFFGYGNETVDGRKSEGMDYNRVRSQVLSVAPSFVWRGDGGAYFSGQLTGESYDVEQTDGRFITSGVVNPDVFETKNFLGANVAYGFENYDNLSNPAMGMRFHMEAGWIFNVDNVSRDVPYFDVMYGVSHRLVPSARWVLATQAKAKFLFSNEYEFYQMATIGGDFDVRAFRSQRFSGKRSFFQSSDLRLEIGKIGKTVVPLKYGLLGGFDYGRVWLPGEDSDRWHTAYGGGLWLNGVNLVTAKLSYFHAADGGRVSFGLGFGF